MLKKAKKFIALVLALLTVFSVMSVSVSAVATTDEDPVIYVLGYGGELFADRNDYSSEKIYPLNTDVGAKVKEALAPCLSALATASLTGDYSEYCDSLYDSVAPIYEGLILNPDGTPQGKSGKAYKVNSAKPNFKRFEGGEYYYFYDWRLSPLTLVDELTALVNKAGNNGEKKVDLVGRCYGGNLISAYLQTTENAEEKIDDVIFYVASTDGIGLVGNIFSGNIQLNAENIDEYVNELVKYNDIIEDGLMKDFISVLLAIFEQAKMLDLSVDKLQALVDEIKDDLIPRLVRASYGSFPSFWAMVPDEMFDETVNFVYNTDEIREEYKGTIDIITRYNTEVQKKSDETLKALAEKGIDIHVVSKYNLPSAPLFGDRNPMSDAISETSRTSFGATTADFGTSFADSYIESMPEESKKYVSPDAKIDASTCLFPDTTWFIKNCYHDYFEADALYAFLNTILTTDDMTIETVAEYPQFIDADITAEQLTPVVGKDKDLPAAGSDDAKFALIFNFVVFILKLLKNVIETYFA